MQVFLFPIYITNTFVLCISWYDTGVLGPFKDIYTLLKVKYTH